jgi:hypothetical protein
MVETMQIESCADCLVAVITGRGPDHLLRRLWREFRGRLIIFEDKQITTFRPCGSCGNSDPGVRYAAVAILRTGEDAEDG